MGYFFVSHPKFEIPSQNYNITYCITSSFCPPRRKTTTTTSPNVCFFPCSPYTKHHVFGGLRLVGCGPFFFDQKNHLFCVAAWYSFLRRSMGGLWGCGHCVDGLCHFIGGPGLESLPLRRVGRRTVDTWGLLVCHHPKPPQTPQKKGYI